MELISVIIPTYNRAEKLVQSVVSVLNQDYDNFEVIVVDDAGDDDTDLSILEGDIYYYLLQNNSVRCPTIMMQIFHIQEYSETSKIIMMTDQR